MDPEDLIGCEVVHVVKHPEYFSIIFDNGHKVEVSAPLGGTLEEAIEECD